MRLSVAILAQASVAILALHKRTALITVALRLHTMVKQSGPRGGSSIVSTKSKAMLKQEAQAEKAFIKSARHDESDELKDFQKFCHDSLNENPQFAPHVAKWFRKDYFTTLAACQTVDGSAIVPADSAVASATVFAGAKIKGKVGKLIKLSTSDKYAIVRSWFPLTDERKSVLWAARYFDLVLQLTPQTPRPTDSSGAFDFQEPLAQALKVCYLLL